jgi:hypothetical protein
LTKEELEEARAQLDPQFVEDVVSKPYIMLLFSEGGNISYHQNVAIDSLTAMGALEYAKQQLGLHHMRVLAAQEAQKQADQVAIIKPQKDLLIPRS